MKKSAFVVSLIFSVLAVSCSHGIDRYALVTRNNPHVEGLDPLWSLNLGNGEFAANFDATGLQTFPEIYKDGLSLGTYSEWAWHSFPNTEGYSEDQSLVDYPLPGHPHGIYSVQKTPDMPQRDRDAAEWFRANPHRLHLGNVGFEGMSPVDISDVDQTLDMWDGILRSSFLYNGKAVKVETVCGGEDDVIAARIESDAALPVSFRFPYPTGAHADDASDWDSDDRHSTEIVSRTSRGALLKRVIDATVYYVRLDWSGNAVLSVTGPNKLTLTPSDGNWDFCIGFYEDSSCGGTSFPKVLKSSRKMWNGYWNTTGIIDFSHCTDSRAALLEKRVVLSQYLMRSQEAQNYPPAETGLTYNSWFGKFHLEMVMFHSFHYATWNQPELLKKQLAFYKKAMPVARQIALRQNLEGVRWMKMTDPSAFEAPSDVGSFLLWQQPHPLYMAELIYRANPDKAFLEEYYDLVQETAKFIASFLVYEPENDRYVILGVTGANESYDKKSTVNPAFEMSYVHFALSTAQLWRERMGEKRVEWWDTVCSKLAPLSTSPDGIYLPAESGPGIPDFGSMDEETANSIRVRATSSENLLAYGMLPECRLFNKENMMLTLDRAEESWDWKGGSWSWNYPALAMNATRLGRTDVALRAITMDNRSDLLLPGGNNYRTTRLRMYLPGNGGLLLAVGMMCAGWDGCDRKNPGFPDDGTWDVRWEGLAPMP